MSHEERKRASAGLVLFVALSFLGSWCVAATLRVLGVSVEPVAIGTRLFTTSLLYALSMGWQPIVATWVVRRWVDPPDQLDLGLRPTRRVFSVVAGLGTLLFVAGATCVAASVAALGLAASTPLNGSGEPQLVVRAASFSNLAILGAAFLAALVLIAVQAFAEEVGWRGYFLPRAMERLGRWQGLILHGAVWGLWYAPVLFFSSYGQLDSFGSLSRSGGFVITCMLLGTLFGWLRLASRSLAPVVLANALLTFVAGLPYVIHGVDAGLRSAALGPPGWFVLLLAIAGLMLSKWKAVVRIPTQLLGLPAPPAGPLMRVAIVLQSPRRPKAREFLH